jgi:curved DNA-binding protein CbpA
MNGQLNAHPLAELITELRAKGFSGSLRLQHEQSKVVIYLEKGKVIYAASNARALRLVEYLTKQELLTEKQLIKYRSRKSDLALADALSADGLLGREQIDMLMSTLVSDALRLALLWTEGTWEFDERARLNDSVHLNLNLERLLIESARRISLDLASRFPDPDEVISPSANYSSIDSLTPTEGFLLSRVDSEIKLRELVALSGVPEAEALRMIYGLTVGGLLKRSQSPIALSRRPQKAAAKPEPKPVAPPPPVVPQRTEEEDLKDFLSRMDAAISYYEVLSIPSEALSDEIKQAYYGVARKYHPDRFRGKAEAQLHARLESAFARITQAYETLMDPKRRKGHDAKLAAQAKAKQLARSAPQAAVSRTKSSTETTPKPDDSKENEKKRAEESFKEGFAALQQGQINLALGLLGAAARAVPEESRYRAYYGRALAAVVKTRHTAEAELQAAIRLDQRNAIYHVMLAELYRDLGFGKRALSAAERALAIDPRNADARDLVRKLK